MSRRSVPVLYEHMAIATSSDVLPSPMLPNRVIEHHHHCDVHRATSRRTHRPSPLRRRPSPRHGHRRRAALRVSPTGANTSGHPRPTQDGASSPSRHRPSQKSNDTSRSWRLPQRDGAVFTAPQNGPVRRGNFRKRVRLPALERAGLNGLRFHDLRHTGNTLAAATGASMRELMARMAFRSQLTTRGPAQGRAAPTRAQRCRASGGAAPQLYTRQSPSVTRDASSPSACLVPDYVTGDRRTCSSGRPPTHPSVAVAL